MWANGYRPVALAAWNARGGSPGKRPVGLEWERRARLNPPDATRWPARHDVTNTGLLTDGLRALDVDFDDVIIAGELQTLAFDMFGAAPMRVRYNSGKFLALYRAAVGEPVKRSLTAAEGKIEVMGLGQQVAAFGTHWSGSPLMWFGGSPLDVHRDKLPPITEDQVTAFLEAAVAITGPAVVRSSSPDARTSAYGLAGDLQDVASAAAQIPNNDAANWDHWTNIGLAIWGATKGAEEGFQIWLAWSEQHEAFDYEALEERWEHFRQSPPTKAGAGKLIHLAREANPDWRQPSRSSDGSEFSVLPEIDPASVAGRQRRFILAPSECDVASARRYVVKGLLAERDVACLFGPPGAGKSLLAPHLCYAIAQGRPFFEMRTNAGGALYVAAEDPSGMGLRVRALYDQRGDALGVGIVHGVNDLLADGSADLAWLLDQVADRRPALIVIDTLAMAFPGLEENDASAMGRVVKVARALTRHGAAVVLVHHDSKAQDGTPRGHSLLNGALDVGIHLAPKDQHGVVRGRMTKNRNGSVDHRFAFKVGVHQFSVDADGDAVDAAHVIELPARAPGSAALPDIPPMAGKALAVLVALAAGVDDVTEEAWHAGCEEQRVSGSDDARNRHKAVAKAIATLIQKACVHYREGRFSPVTPGSEFVAQGVAD